MANFILQTTALVHSFIFAMCIRPEIAAKVQAEIDAQVGRDRIPALSDREVLPYTEAVLQEVIRFYPVFPLGRIIFPRAQSYVSNHINGYNHRSGALHKSGCRSPWS